MVGPPSRPMKGVCPPTRPRTCPHERTFAREMRRTTDDGSGSAPSDAETGPAGQPPAGIRAELQARERIVAEEEIPVQVCPFRERRDRRRGRDHHARLLHAAEE